MLKKGGGVSKGYFVYEVQHTDFMIFGIICRTDYTLSNAVIMISVPLSNQPQTC